MMDDKCTKRTQVISLEESVYNYSRIKKPTEGVDREEVADVEEMMGLTGSNVTFVMYVMCNALTLTSHLTNRKIRT